MTVSPTDLPAGLTARPLTLADAGATAALIVAEELHDVGVAEIEEADIIADWQRPSFDLGSSTLGVFDGAQLVAYAEVSSTFSTAAVLPTHRRRGIGTALADWMRSTSRARGESTLGTTVAEHTPAQALLTKLGYEPKRSAWDFELTSIDGLAAAEAPAGIDLRTATETEHEAVWTVIEDAFLEWADRARRSFGDWSARAVERPGFQPWHARVAVEGDTVIAAAILAARDGGGVSIEQLATRKDHRGRGLGTALITDAVRVSAAHGARQWTLQTDSRTGAKDLYERVGLQVRSTWVYLEAQLD